MRKIPLQAFWVTGLIFATAGTTTVVQEQNTDIVIYGATSGGIAAAVTARRMGARVVLLEPSSHVGGLTTGGLGATDTGNQSAIGGLAREFYRRVRDHYRHPSAWKYESLEAYAAKPRNRMLDDTLWHFEPHVALRVYQDMLSAAGIVPILNARLDRENGVTIVKDSQGLRRIASVRVRSGRVYRGTIFIDATYEGDLMAAAGVSYHVGREANDRYGETLNGNQARNATKHQFTHDIDPYRRIGDPSSGLLPGIGPEDAGVDGAGDHRVQAYNFRMCLTDVPSNRAPFSKPVPYDETLYELLLRNYEAGDRSIPLRTVPMPNRKTDSNNSGAFSTDFIGANYAYPEASDEERARIIAAHKHYQQGLMWTLAHHPRVPESIRAHFQTWGLAADEFVDNDYWPPQLYVREARRMRGPVVMTQQHCQGREIVSDSVGLASYTMDSHNVRRYVDARGFVRNEGDVQVGGAPPYPISWRAIHPHREECGNLLVPVCLSASHIAYGSIRMEPVFMVLGQSAATAAVLGLSSPGAVQDIDYNALRRRLLADGQILEWTESSTDKSIPTNHIRGIVLDDAMAILEGEWFASASLGPHVGKGYVHDNGADKGNKRAIFPVSVPSHGTHEVRMVYTPSGNRASSVPVCIDHDHGRANVRVNQRVASDSIPCSASLGSYFFSPDKPARVVIETTGTQGHVIVDAIILIPQPDPDVQRDGPK